MRNFIFDHGTKEARALVANLKSVKLVNDVLHNLHSRHIVEELAQHDDHMLSDMGLTRKDVEDATYFGFLHDALDDLRAAKLHHLEDVGGSAVNGLDSPRRNNDGFAAFDSKRSSAMAEKSKSTRDEIIALEKSYWDALIAKDGKRTAALSGESSLVTGVAGVMRIAKEDMGKLTEEGNWTLESYTFDNVQVEVPAPDVAIIVYTAHQKGTRSGKPTDMHAAYSSTWLRGKNGWECHAHSESHLMGDKAA
jgi:uncharacterized protein YjiS (DUF1127 family)/ketosteroid isomerase-like protein